VFENRVLRRIFGPKRDEVTGGWRKLHNEELHNLHTSPNEIKEEEMGMECSTLDLLGKLEGRRPLRRPRHS
jgi:hypothetical protein